MNIPTQIYLLKDANGKPEPTFGYDLQGRHLPTSEIGHCELQADGIYTYHSKGCDITVNPQQAGTYWMCVKNANWDLAYSMGATNYYWHQSTDTNGYWNIISSYAYKGQ